MSDGPDAGDVYVYVTDKFIRAKLAQAQESLAWHQKMYPNQNECPSCIGRDRMLDGDRDER